MLDFLLGTSRAKNAQAWSPRLVHWNPKLPKSILDFTMNKELRSFRLICSGMGPRADLAVYSESG